MTKSFFLIGLVVTISNSFGQNFAVNPAITLASGYGNYHPQIEVLGDGELGVIWTNAATEDLYFAKRTGIDQFAAPIQLNPLGLEVQDYNWSGADLAVWENNVYVIFRSLAGEENGHVYLVKSTDNGLTFGDTVRVDNLVNAYAQFPDVTVYNDTVFVTFMEIDLSTSEAQYVSSRSVDAGVTFEPQVDASALIGNESCDCCQPEIIADDSRVLIFFRNNDANLREMKAVVSYDRGASYTDWISVDDHNWIIASCPSSGPDARFVNGDVVLSAYRTMVGGQPKIFLNEYNLSTDISETMVDIYTNGASNTGINFPQVAIGNGAMGIVWEGLGNGTDIFFNGSVSGAIGMLPTNAINLTDSSGSQSKPDIVILNGQYHIVYSELTGASVKYVRIGTVNAVDENSQYLSTLLYPNPTSNNAIINFSAQPKTDVTVTITNSNGQLVNELYYMSPPNYIDLKLDEIPTGIYFIHINFDGRSETHRLVKN